MTFVLPIYSGPRASTNQTHLLASNHFTVPTAPSSTASCYSLSHKATTALVSSLKASLWPVHTKPTVDEVMQRLSSYDDFFHTGDHSKNCPCPTISQLVDCLLKVIQEPQHLDDIDSDNSDEDILAFKIPKQRIPQKPERKMLKPGKKTEVPIPPPA